jgi:hypothetical protein
MRPRFAGLLLAVLLIHALGGVTWFAFFGLSDLGTGRELGAAVAIGAVLWLAMAVLILVLWRTRRSARWWVWIPFVWWYPAFLLVVVLVYGLPVVAQAGASASTTASEQPQATLPATTTAPATTVSPTPPPPATVPATTPEPTYQYQCREPGGIRYAGTTAEGAKVCFTLTRDRSAWVEIGYAFIPESGCGDSAERTTYLGPPPVPLDGAGRIDLLIESGTFFATIQGAKASGTFSDGTICGSKRFEWHARRVPR